MFNTVEDKLMLIIFLLLISKSKQLKMEKDFRVRRKLLLGRT